MARELFDRIVVGILINSGKSPLFTVEERVQTVRGVFRDHPSVEVETFEGSLIDYAHRRQASVIVRGLRAISDFESELQMALMNRRLDPDLETVFMMPTEPLYLRQLALVKEVFALGGSITGLVPEAVESRLRRKHRTGAGISV